MADEFKIEGVRLEELEPLSVLDDEAIFLVSSNKVCRIISLSSLRKAFAGNPSSPNKDEVYYNATYIDNKFEVVENNVTDVQNTVKNFTSEITQQVQNINNKIDQFKLDIDNKVEQSINNALTQIDNKIIEKISQVKTELESTIDEKIKTATDKIDTKLTNYVQKSNKSSITVQASGWTGDDRNPPFRNVLTITGVTNTNNVEVLLPGTATLEQVEAWCAAGVVHGTQTTNSITLLGYGDKPEIDIPLEVIIRKDI